MAVRVNVAVSTKQKWELKASLADVFIALLCTLQTHCDKSQVEYVENLREFKSLVDSILIPSQYHPVVTRGATGVDTLTSSVKLMVLVCK